MNCEERVKGGNGWAGPNDLHAVFVCCISMALLCLHASQDEALDLINLECGTAYELATPWHHLFLEGDSAADGGAPVAAAEAAGTGPGSIAAAAAAAAGAGAKGGVLGADLPSEDEDDSDFE